MCAQAAQRVVITMPTVKPDDPDFMQLIAAMDEAIKRGVRCDIFVNTQYTADGWVWLTKAFAGYDPGTVEIWPVAANHFRFHRMVVADGTKVLEGALDWSKDRGDEPDLAARSDDPKRAAALVKRLVELPHAGTAKTVPTAPLWRSVLCGMPQGKASMSLPVALVKDARYLPRMIDRKDERALRAMLLLYAAAAYAKADTFTVDLARTAQGIGRPGKISAARDAVERVAKRYGLCTIGKKSTKTTLEVTLMRPSGDAFTVPTDIADPEFLAETPYLLTVGFVTECYLRRVSATVVQK
jgi:hypothetical protein